MHLSPPCRLVSVQSHPDPCAQVGDTQSSACLLHCLSLCHHWSSGVAFWLRLDLLDTDDSGASRLSTACIVVLQEADSKLGSQIRSLDENKKEVARLTDSLLQKT